MAHTSLRLLMLFSIVGLAAVGSASAEDVLLFGAGPEGSPSDVRGVPALSPTPALSGGSSVRARYAQLPLQFEANLGQADASVKFLAGGLGYTVFLTPSEAVLVLPSSPARDETPRAVVPGPGRRARGEHEKKNSPARGSSEVQLRFVVAPGADPTRIRLAVARAETLSVDATGDLVLQTSSGTLRLHRPLIYQEAAGGRQEIAGGYVRFGKDQIGIHVAAYDAGKPLVIDPVLGYSTYLGGSASDSGYGIAVDNAGNAYVTGITSSTNFPTVNALQPTFGGNFDVFVAKLIQTQAPATPLVAAALPVSRSIQTGATATAFATMINTSPGPLTDCSIAQIFALPTIFLYQTTDPNTNALVGTPNTPVTIQGNNGFQTFLIALTANAAFPPTDVQLSFNCQGTQSASIVSGLNTLLLSASYNPVPDIVALGATPSGDGIVNIPGVSGTGFFAVATVNVGASGAITASADTGGVTLPVNIALCQTNPVTSLCIAPLGPTVTTQINAGETPTFAIFVQGNGSGPVPFAPAVNRITVRFKDAGSVTRGPTSVAVRTQ